MYLWRTGPEQPVVTVPVQTRRLGFQLDVLFVMNFSIFKVLLYLGDSYFKRNLSKTSYFL